MVVVAAARAVTAMSNGVLGLGVMAVIISIAGGCGSGRGGKVAKATAGASAAIKATTAVASAKATTLARAVRW